MFTAVSSTSSYAISGIPPSIYPAIAIDKYCKQLREKMQSINQMLETLEKEGQTDTEIYHKLLKQYDELFRQFHDAGCHRIPPIRRAPIPVSD